MNTDFSLLTLHEPTKYNPRFAGAGAAAWGPSARGLLRGWGVESLRADLCISLTSQDHGRAGGVEWPLPSLRRGGLSALLLSVVPFPAVAA